MYNALLCHNRNVREVLTNKDESFDNDLTCQLSETVKAKTLLKKVLSSGMKPNAKDI